MEGRRVPTPVTLVFAIMSTTTAKMVSITTIMMAEFTPIIMLMSTTMEMGFWRLLSRRWSF